MRIYFCSDIHASEKCWKKFLNAPKFYEADVIVVGGDITGKFVIPIIEQKKGKYTCRFAGVKRKVSSPEELSTLLARIADSGAYGYVTTPDEVAHYEGNQAEIDKLFQRLIMERVDRWLEMAEERLGGTGTRVLVSGANDDFFEIDDHLARSSLIEDPNGRVLPLGDGFEIVGMGYGNQTPWSCPRDIDEPELAARIDEAVTGAADPAKTLFSLHVPPLGSGLDLAPELTDNLQLVASSGGLNMVPVGSTAVRDAVIKYRPLIGLHGHIHESRGIVSLDDVTITNPGSEYSEGILDGVVIDLDKNKGVVSTKLVRG
jgi:uncharacterized protein